MIIIVDDKPCWTKLPGGQWMGNCMPDLPEFTAYGVIAPLCPKVRELQPPGR
jgi:hypothetical protein